LTHPRTSIPSTEGHEDSSFLVIFWTKPSYSFSSPRDLPISLNLLSLFTLAVA